MVRGAAACNTSIQQAWKFKSNTQIKALGIIENNEKN